MARVGALLARGEGDSLEHTKRLSCLLLELLQQEHGQELEDKEGWEPECLDISRSLTASQLEDLQKAVPVLFSTQLHREIFFSPLQDLNLHSTHLQQSLVHHRFMTAWDQASLEMDLLSARTLILISDLLSCDTLLLVLDATSFFTMRYLVGLEETRHPHLSPVRLQQIEDHNVGDCSNFLAGYSQLESLPLLRYLVHLVRLDPDCCLLVLQAHILSLPPPCLLFLTFSYNEVLLEAATLGEGQLEEQVEQEVARFLSRSLSCHLPGWATSWEQVFQEQPGLLALMEEAFRSSNLARLGRRAGLVGAHREREGLEVAALGDLLLARSGQEEVAWCREALYLPGLVRAVLARPQEARGQLDLLLELGDVALLREVGLLSTLASAREVVEHLASVYQEETCPMAWEEVARALLARLSAVDVLGLLQGVVAKLGPGTFSRG